MLLAQIICGVIAVILFGGLVGGCINYLQARKGDEQTPRHGAYYFLLSTAAAFSVPLFLSLTKSELLKNVLAETGPYKVEDWFILFAVCLIAAIYAQVFLESVSKNLMQRVATVEAATKKAVEKADEAASDASEAVQSTEKAVEKIEGASPSPPVGTGAPVDEQPAELDAARIVPAPIHKVHISQYDETSRRVIEALRKSSKSLRSISGISEDAGLSRPAVRAILARLIRDGVVLETIGPKTGNLLYMLRLEALRED